MAENILHYGAVRLRVSGEGSLLLKMKGLDDVITQDLASLTLSLTPGREPTQLANFKTQRMRLRISVSGINQHFSLNRLVIYAKELWQSYPQ